VWLIEAVVCPCAAPRVQLFVSAGSGWPRDATRYHWLMPVSCHFQDCKSASEFDSCKQRYSKYPTFIFTFYFGSAPNSIPHVRLYCSFPSLPTPLSPVSFLPSLSGGVGQRASSKICCHLVHYGAYWRRTCGSAVSVFVNKNYNSRFTVVYFFVSAEGCSAAGLEKSGFKK